MLEERIGLLQLQNEREGSAAPVPYSESYPFPSVGTERLELQKGKTVHGLEDKENGKRKRDGVNEPVVRSAEHNQAAAAVSFDLTTGGAG